jgi:hypothetical protein
LPARPFVNKVVQIGLNQLLLSATRDIINRLFVAYTGTAPTNAQLDTFSTAISGIWSSNMKSLFNEDHELTSVTTEDLTSATGAVGIDTTTVSGTRAGATLSAASSVVCSHSIARRYRGGHPRTYFAAGVAADLFTLNLWEPSFLTAVATAFSTFVGDLESLGWTGSGGLTLVNVSYYEGFTNHTYPSGRTRPIPNLRATPVVDAITTTVIRQSVGSQRRRNEFVG